LRPRGEACLRKAEEEEPTKSWDEMTWPERAAEAAFKAMKECKDQGYGDKVAEAKAEEAGEAVMRRAKQFGYIEPPTRKKFDAAKGQAQGKKLSPVEQARQAGMHAGVFGGGGGPTFKGGGSFGMSAPKMSGGMEGGYMG